MTARMTAWVAWGAWAILAGLAILLQVVSRGAFPPLPGASCP
jgi:hypothetical protein